MNLLDLKPLTSGLIPAAVELDKLCLGGLWTQSGYERELESPNSDLLILQPRLEDSQDQQERPAKPEAIQFPILGLGCVWEILEEAHITILAVHPDHQRQGLGRVLLCALMAAARQRGSEWATLEVRVSNQPALALYQQFGFEKIGHRRCYYQDNGEDALILWYRGIQNAGFHQKLADWQQTALDRLTQAGWGWSAGTILAAL